MTDPLIKRLPREFKSDLGKYAVIFLFLVMLISLVSGFIVATDSMLAAYDEGFDKYTVEHGHITFDKQPPAELLQRIEDECGVTLYDLKYFDSDLNGDKKTRVYVIRDKVNLECVMSGELPSAENEIALDRMFAENNKIAVGDTVTVNGKELAVTGLVALPDYSCLYEKNTDMVFDALGFNAGVMTEGGFAAMGCRTRYNYAWLYNDAYDREDKAAANDRSTALLDKLADIIGEYDEAIVKQQTEELSEKLETAGKEYALLMLTTGKAPAKEQLSVELSDFLFEIVEGYVQAEMKGEEYAMPDESEFEREIDKTLILGVDDYIPQYLNQAITFTGMDMGGDKITFIVFAYIVIAVLAFIFAVTTSATIAADAGVIGTLRASGYSRGELTRHYLILPVAITLAAAIVGNILGYTVLKGMMADMYYQSYSLPTYKVLWSADAFLLTTLIPAALMFVINFVVIASKMRLSPLQLLRRELKKNPRKKALRLNTKIPFIHRFRLRIILRNLPNYAVMAVGIVLGSIVIIFGEIFGTIFVDYTALMIDSVLCDYQYVLLKPAETATEGAEKYSMTSFEFQYRDFVKDEVTVFGIDDGSRYFEGDLSGGRTLVSATVAEKYGIGAGDTLTLSNPYNREEYTVCVDDVCDYQASLAVFVSRGKFNETFGMEQDYYTGYFSDAEITDISAEDIAAVVTVNDYTKLSDQMEHSVGGFMKLFGYFGVIMFVLIMYILSKQVIERDFQSISMCKILGFRDGEIGGLYIISTSVSVLFALLIAVPIADASLHVIMSEFMYKMMTGYFPYNIRPESYIKMIVIGIVSYAAVAALQMIKINKVPKGEALKNRE